MRRAVPPVVALLLSLALAFAPTTVQALAGPAFPPPADPDPGLVVQVEVYGWMVAVRNKLAGIAVRLTITAADGSLKFQRTTEDLNSTVAFYPGLIMPGDVIRLQHGPVNKTWTVPVINLSANPVTDTVTGRVSPRKDLVKVYGASLQLNAPAYSTFLEDAGPDPSGKFSLAVGAAGDILRGSWIYVYYREDGFLPYRRAAVPGLQLALGNSEESGYMLPSGKAYDLRLLSPAGVQKALSRMSVSDEQWGFLFLKPSGRPVSIDSGDSVQVIGPGGFTVKVKLAIEHPPDGNVTTIRTKPGSALQIRFQIHDPGDGHSHEYFVKGTADSDGVYVRDWGPAVPTGDRLLIVTVEEPAGNRFFRAMPIPPVF
jgi:hypothetical protein